ncbi:MAG: hypothetical protein PVS3B3_36850 [Ktedonobacteraceae bacterium]
MFSMSFDQASLSQLAQIYGWKTFLTNSVGTAIQQSGDLLTQAAQANTESAFKSPTGALRDSIAPVMTSPWEVQIGVGVAYGPRLEFGFGPNGSAATDSLGRTYHNPAEPYMTPAFNDNQQAVLQLIDQAILNSFGGGA